MEGVRNRKDMCIYTYSARLSQHSREGAPGGGGTVLKGSLCYQKEEQEEG